MSTAAANSLSEGIDFLYSGRADYARARFEEAERGLDRPAVAAAYAALAHRIAFDADLAREAISRAKELDDSCFEAYAAESVLLLTRKRLEPALAAWEEARRRKPYGLEGHFLKLVLLCLWTEALAGAGDSGIVSFRITPVTRAAVMILDGNARTAPEPGHGGPLETLATALLSFRKGDRGAAAGLIRALDKLGFGDDSLVESFEALGTAA